MKTNPLDIGQRIQLKIDRLSYDGGRGVGRYNNFVVFVPQTAPEETVQVEITEIKKNFSIGKLIDVVEPSPYRRQAPCPVAQRCGGCPWQHVTYEEQLRQKKQLIAFYLKKYLPVDYVLPDVIAAPNEFRYRHRVQIHEIAGRPGYFAPGTNDHVPIDDCLIADEGLFKDLPQPLARSAGKNKFEIRLNDQGQREIVPLNNAAPEFTQVNRAQNQEMQRRVVAYAKECSPIAEIHDLYCGDGNLTAPLFSQFPEAVITGVESAKNSIAKAKNRGIAVKFLNADVEDHLQHLKSLKKNSLVVVDPPRAGLTSATTKELLRLTPQHLIYVSCNLLTYARDVETLRAKYELKSVTGLDMFPQTEYVEIVSLLSLRDYTIRTRVG